MNVFYTIYSYIDRFLIWFYRIAEIPIVGYYLGTSVLALICVVLGHITLTIAKTINKKHIDSQNHQMIKMHNLSLYALLAKDKHAYKSCNKEANEAFGKYFFSQLAISISSLWPIPFALGWMQTRFSNVNFLLPFHIPYIGDSVGYTFTFIPMYILIYILYENLRALIINNKQSPSSNDEPEKMLGLSDVFPPAKIGEDIGIGH